MKKKLQNCIPKRAELQHVFEKYLADLGLRQTRQRLIILDAVLASGRHVDAETIAKETKKLDRSIGLATVYRTLKMMTGSGILVERHFNENRASFELADKENEHHDHLICNQCGEIVEFFDEELENIQIKIANELGFNLKTHKMELFADCLRADKCSYKNKGKNPNG